MTKREATISIIIWSCVAVLLIALLATASIFVSRINIGSFFAKGELREIFSAQGNAASFDSVDIAWYAGNVTVTRSPDDKMQLKQTSYYDVSPIEYGISDGKLTIKQKGNWGFFFFGFGFFNQSSDLELSLPQKQYERFILKMTSGHTAMHDVTSKTTQITMTSGNLQADNLQSGDLSIGITSGKITASSVKAYTLSYL